jgi:transposase
MTEISTELIGRLVVSRKRDGRCKYDPQAKTEVVRACLKPGVSVARVAMQCGVNANLLRRWIEQHQGAAAALMRDAEKRQGANAAFVPLQIEAAKTQAVAVQGPRMAPAAQPVLLRLHVRLPNGVAFDLSQTGVDELPAVIRILSALPCSNSISR